MTKRSRSSNGTGSALWTGPQCTRRSWLAGAGAAAFLGGIPALAQGIGRRRLIVVLANGGWDVTYCMDPKRHVATVEGPEIDSSGRPEDQESVETFHGLPVVVNEVRRPSVSRFFQDFGDRCAVVNGIHVGSLGHTECRGRMLTGAVRAQPGPDLVTIFGSVQGNDLPVGSVALSALSLPGSLAPTTMSIGSAGQVSLALDGTIPAPVLPGGPHGDLPLFATTEGDRAAIERWRAGRIDALAKRRVHGLGRSRGRLMDLVESVDRAERLVAQRDAITSSLQFGYAVSLDTNMLLATDLLELGICASVFLDTTLDWDSHRGTADQHGMFEYTFSNLHALATDLRNRNMLDDTLVVVLSEMGRAPTRNALSGKDHWPYTSAILLGGGTVGGQVLGGSDDVLTPLPVDYETGMLWESGDYLDYASFNAGLLERLDIDPQEWFPDIRPWRGGIS